MEQLGSQWMDFDEILHLSVFQKYVKKIQVSLNSDKNIKYFIWRPMYIYDSILLNSSGNEKFFRKSCRENQNTHLWLLFLFWNCAIYGTMWKNMEEP